MHALAGTKNDIIGAGYRYCLSELKLSCLERKKFEFQIVREV